MPQYSPRRVLQKENDMFRRAGRPMALYLRTDYVGDSTGVPTSLIDDSLDISDSQLSKVYVFGIFEEQDKEEYGDVGQVKYARGWITIPMRWRAQLNMAEYIDPYNDGVSRFRKEGAIINQSRGYIAQFITSLSTQVNAGVSQ